MREKLLYIYSILLLIINCTGNGWVVDTIDTEDIFHEDISYDIIYSDDIGIDDIKNDQDIFDTIQDKKDIKDNIEEEPLICNGDCIERRYTECSCSVEDPCGWQNDGICDDGCNQFESHFDDSLDCFIDLDQDGLDDNFEYEIAKRFEPYLWFTSREGDRNQRNPHFAVREIQEDGETKITIFYAISYFKDYGDPDLGGLTSHNGDSEFIVLILKKNIDDEWEVEFVFLSAHYATPTDSSGWYSGSEFHYYEDDEGNLHPEIYVAEWKHGNYPDVSTCNVGGFFQDHCSADVGEFLGIEPGKNLGEEYSQLIDEVVINGRVEYYWENIKFCGWQIDSTLPQDRTNCATSYITFINKWINDEL